MHRTHASYFTMITRSSLITPQGTSNKQRGAALALALITVTIVAGLGAAYLQIAASTTKRLSANTESMQSFYLAEAGLAEAFAAVRIGRSGQVGSESAPARYGDGLLWVDAYETIDGQVRLESTALQGMGRSTLALVLEPVEMALGFFSVEDLIIEDVMLLDGFDSQEKTYAAEVAALTPPKNSLSKSASDVLDSLVARAGMAVVLQELEWQLPDAVEYLCWVAYLRSPEDMQAVAAAFPEMTEAYNAGTLFSAPEAPSGGEVLPDTPPVPAPTSTQGPTTGSGGLVSSNGDIVFMSSGDGSAELFGDVRPGVGGQVVGADNLTITGETEPLTTPIELASVEIPSVTLDPALRQDDIFPLEIPSGISGYKGIEVAAESELILRGPATIVIGQLTLEPGALLFLDTRGGNVDLYITEGVNFQPGSLVSMSSESPAETTVQVAPIPSTDGPPVNFDATSQFYGTIYAPETEVRIGTDFEIYGGAVARRLTLASGVRLHFDNAGYEGSPIPKIIGWMIVELPSAIKGSFGDPYSILGVKKSDLSVLAESHDLKSVQITVTFIGKNGLIGSYQGTEDQFDWSKVAQVTSVDRDATLVKEKPSKGTFVDANGAPTDPGPTPTGVRNEVTKVTDLIDQYGMVTGGSYTVGVLAPLHPLSAEEWSAISPYASDMDPANWDAIVAADLASGGTAGPAAPAN